MKELTIMEELKHMTMVVTQELYDNSYWSLGQDQNHYANGKEIMVGDTLLHVAFVEKDSIGNIFYRLSRINYNDLGGEYNFTGEFAYDSPSSFPIVEGNYIIPEGTENNVLDRRYRC